MSTLPNRLLQLTLRDLSALAGANQGAGVPISEEVANLTLGDLIERAAALGGLVLSDEVRLTTVSVADVVTAATGIEITPERVRAWIRRGVLPSVEDGGRNHLTTAGAVREGLEAGRLPPKPGPKSLAG